MTELTYPSRAVDPDVEAILARIAGNDAYTDDRYEVVKAILKAAASNDGEVDPNVVRGDLDDVVAHYVIGATYKALAAAGVIRVTGWTINEDKHSNNGGKPIRLYELVADLDEVLEAERP